MKTKKRFKTPQEIADFWNIPHLVSVDNLEAWKLSFSALMKATILLDKQNSAMVKLQDEKLELLELVEELDNKNSNLFLALENIAADYDLDIADYFQLEE